MEVSEFMRVTYYTIWNNMVKGFYGLDDKHPIDQQCMGDWMQDDIDYLMDIYTEEAYYGLTTVSYERSLEAAMKSVDLVYNSDYQCQYETIMFDIIYTAFDQYDYNVAEFITQITENYAANMLPLAFKMFDLYQLTINDMDKCFTDAEYIEEVGYKVEDVSAMASTILGLDLDWQKADVYQG